MDRPKSTVFSLIALAAIAILPSRVSVAAGDGAGASDLHQEACESYKDILKADIAGKRDERERQVRLFEARNAYYGAIAQALYDKLNPEVQFVLQKYAPYIKSINGGIIEESALFDRMKQDQVAFYLPSPFRKGYMFCPAHFSVKAVSSSIFGGAKSSWDNVGIAYEKNGELSEEGQSDQVLSCVRSDHSTDVPFEDKGHHPPYLVLRSQPDLEFDRSSGKLVMAFSVGESEERSQQEISIDLPAFSQKTILEGIWPRGIPTVGPATEEELLQQGLAEKGCVQAEANPATHKKSAANKPVPGSAPAASQNQDRLEDERIAPETSSKPPIRARAGSSN